MISKVLRAKLLQELHVRHISIVNGRISQKSFWWSHVDQGVEATATQYEACKITAAMSTQAALNQWQYPSTPWERLYIVYGEFNKTDFLVMVDAFSKWPEVKMVSSTTTQKTVTILSVNYLPCMDFRKY